MKASIPLSRLSPARYGDVWQHYGWSPFGRGRMAADTIVPFSTIFALEGLNLAMRAARYAPELNALWRTLGLNIIRDSVVAPNELLPLIDAASRDVAAEPRGPNELYHAHAAAKGIANGWYAGHCNGGDGIEHSRALSARWHAAVAVVRLCEGNIALALRELNENACLHAANAAGDREYENAYARVVDRSTALFLEAVS